jgi:uncharacterized membrane protein required for colicin V production
VDYVAATLLVAGGVLALRRGRADWLTASWGFACAMFWMSFFGHYHKVMTTAAANDPREQRLTLIIGIMFGLTVLGFVTAGRLHAKSEACMAYLILPSLNSTCLRTTGSYFRTTIFSVLVRAFFLAT